jgi:hypothetical protein
MNMSNSQSPQSLFLNIIVCTNVTYQGLESFSRNILVNLELKTRQEGVSKQIEMFDTEDERITALKRVFGIELTREEKDSIKGSKLAVENFDRHTKQTVF